MHIGATWRIPLTEPSVCGGDPALRQISFDLLLLTRHAVKVGMLNSGRRLEAGRVVVWSDIVQDFLKPRLHDTTGCQTGCQTGLTTGLTAVSNEQLFVPPVVKHGLTTG